MAVQMLGIKTKFTDDQGRPLVGGSVHTYYAGTSLPQDTFSDPELTVPNTNPVKLDDTGSANIFLKGTYRVRVFDKNGKFVEEQDNVSQLVSRTEADFINENIATATQDLIKAKGELEKLKEKNMILESVSDLSTLISPKNGLRIYVKSYHAGLNKGGGYFVYDSSRSSINDGGLVVNGWVRENVSAITPAYFGALGDGVTPDLKALNAFFTAVGSLGYGKGEVGAVYLIDDAIIVNASEYFKLDFLKARIKTNFKMGVGVRKGVLAIHNKGTIAESTCEINDMYLDLTSQVVAVSTGESDLQGIAGLGIVDFETNIINNYKCENAFFGSGLTLLGFTTNHLNNITLKDCGVKINPTTDDTGVYDAAGDGLYLGNPRGKAKTIINNFYANSPAGYFGRGGIVFEDFKNESEHHLVIVNNGHLDNYHRGIHQEDGGKSKLIWNGGEIKHCANSFYNIGGSDREYASFNGTYIEVSTNAQYGGTSGLLNMQNKGFIVLNDCDVNYTTQGQLSERGHFKVSGGSINYANAKVTSATDYIGKSFNNVDIKFGAQGSYFVSPESTILTMSDCRVVSSNLEASLSSGAAPIEINNCNLTNVVISATNVINSIKNSTLIYNVNFPARIIKGYAALFNIENSRIISTVGTLKVNTEGRVGYHIHNSKLQDITIPTISLTSSKDGIFVAKNNEFIITSKATQNPIVAEYGEFHGIIQNNVFYNEANFEVALPAPSSTTNIKNNTVHKKDGSIINNAGE